MDKKFWLGIAASVILSVAATAWAVLSFASEAWVAQIAKDNQSVSQEDLDEVKSMVGDVNSKLAAIDGKLASSNQVQQAILQAILND